MNDNDAMTIENCRSFENAEFTSPRRVSPLGLKQL
jgi:hypothetical protein